MRPLARLGSAGLVSGLSLLLAAAVTASSPAPAARVPRSPQVRSAARLMPSHYTVRRGDTLSKIAAREYGHAGRWPALWWVNKGKISNPNAIQEGDRLRLSTWHPDRPWLDHAALAAIPRPKPARRSAPAPAAAPEAGQAAPPAQQPVAASSGAPGSFEACVIARESGGDPSAVNPSSGAGGLYGFLPSTWQALGHSGTANQASVAEQRQAFQQEYAQAGTAPWAPYDGC